MVNLSDIIDSVAYDMIVRSSGSKTPILIVNNECSNTCDPMINTAKEIAIRDMEEEITYIHPEIVEGD